MSINHVVNNTINLDCKSLKVNNQPVGGSGKFLIEFGSNLNAITFNYLDFQINHIGSPVNSFYNIFRVPFKCKILSFKVFKQNSNPKLYQMFIADSNGGNESEIQQLYMTNTDKFKLFSSIYNNTIEQGQRLYCAGANDGNNAGISKIEVLLEQVE